MSQTHHRNSGSIRPGPPKARVVVVDDERVIALTITEILSQNGYCATGFSKPEEALLLLESCQPQLLLSDLSMPVLCGIELADQVLLRFPDCKVVLLTAHAGSLETSCRERILNSGFVLLAKPIHPIELLRILDDLTASMMVN